MVGLFSRLLHIVGARQVRPYGDAMHAAHMAKRRRTQEAATAFPWLMYVAVMDPTTRPSHAALNGLIWRKDDPVWKVICPPICLGCRCRTRALTDGQLRRERLKPTEPAEILRRIAPDGATRHGVRYLDQRSRQHVTVWL